MDPATMAALGVGNAAIGAATGGPQSAAARNYGAPINIGAPSFTVPGNAASVAGSLTSKLPMLAAFAVAGVALYAVITK